MIKCCMLLSDCIVLRIPIGIWRIIFLEVQFKNQAEMNFFPGFFFLLIFRRQSRGNVCGMCYLRSLCTHPYNAKCLSEIITIWHTEVSIDLKCISTWNKIIIKKNKDIDRWQCSVWHRSKHKRAHLQVVQFFCAHFNLLASFCDKAKRGTEPDGRQEWWRRRAFQWTDNSPSYNVKLAFMTNTYLFALQKLWIFYHPVTSPLENCV